MRTLWLVIRKHPTLPKFVVLRAFYDKKLDAREWLADHKDIDVLVEWNGSKWEISHIDRRYPNEIIEIVATQINGE